MEKGNIILSNVSKRYLSNERLVLDDVSLNIVPGEMVSLTGKSGSGKTTLLNIIGGLDIPSSGKVIIGDFVLTDKKESEISEFRSKNIGFVFQFFNLISEFTVRENIMFPLSLRGVKPDEPYIRYLMSTMNIEGLADRSPASLSGGEQQRVAIARALYSRPQILLLDEPTGNLDEAAALCVMDVIKKANEETGVTVICVTHDNDVAEQFARKIRLRDGKIR